MTQNTSPAAFDLAINEAAQRLSEQGAKVTPAILEAALLRELGLHSREDLLNTAWTSDVIIHHVLHVDFGAPST